MLSTEQQPLLTTTSVLLGHYICDRIHPDNCPDEPTDPWLTLNDLLVLETTGESVCKRRQNSAYILFYQRNVSKKHFVILVSRRRGTA